MGNLSYMYMADPEAASLPLLGSAIRALGKEWNVAAAPSEHQAYLFSPLLGLLEDPGKFHIVNGASELESLLEGDGLDLLLVSKLAASKSMREIIARSEEGCHLMIGGYVPSFMDQADLVSRFTNHRVVGKGVTAFTGNGKGKSTSAYGLALRDLPEGGRVAVVQWFKERKGERGTWSINEHYFPDLLKDSERFEFYPSGLGFFGSPGLDRVKGAEAYRRHKGRARTGLELARSLIDSGDYSTVVLDEFVDTVPEIAENIEYPLLDLTDVVDLLRVGADSNTEVIFTGRRITDDIRPFVKSSYLVEEFKHPFSTSGATAVSGLDF
jgi:cob(I)alamin adenosyltransferase